MNRRDNMLEIKELSYGFGKKKVIDHISYHFNPGIYGLLGPNGSGKTTLMRCLTGIYPTKTGVILYDNIPITKNKLFFEQMSYLPQKFGLFKDLTVKEMMLMMASLRGIDIKSDTTRVEECVSIVNLSDKLNDKVRTLSGGMIRRLGIAQTLLNNPKIIIFDEPTVGLDIEERLRFKNIVSEISKDKIIIISTHIVEDIEALCDVVLIMKNNRISFSGSCEAIREQARNKAYTLPKNQLPNIADKYYLQQHFEEEEQRFVRILTNNKGLTNSTEVNIKPVEPTIEDGYICLLKDI